LIREKPNCSGWEEIVLYRFSIVCDASCSSEYGVCECMYSGNSRDPLLILPNVSAGSLMVTVIAENSWG